MSYKKITVLHLLKKFLADLLHFQTRFTRPTKKVQIDYEIHLRSAETYHLKIKFLFTNDHYLVILRTFCRKKPKYLAMCIVRLLCTKLITNRVEFNYIFGVSFQSGSI